MHTSVQLIGFLDMFKLALLMMIPGQCFWTGLAIAKLSLRSSTIFQLGCAFAYIAIYGILNEFGGKFLGQINQNALNIARGGVLIAIGFFTLYSIWKNVSDSKKIHSDTYPSHPPKQDFRVFLLGAGLIITNPMIYALLIPYTEPIVKLQYHWSIYAVFMYVVVIFPVYFAAYKAASKMEILLKGVWGKLFWSGVALLPIYYGVEVLLHIL